MGKDKNCGALRPQVSTASGTNAEAASTYNPDGAVNSALKNKYGNSYEDGGCCSGFVKAAMCDTSGGKLNNRYEDHLNACAVSYWMEYWGFKMVLSGEGRTLPKGFVPLNGDVLVAAACPSKNVPYGHIQIYNASSKNWIADVPYQSAGVYRNPAANLWAIYRK